MSHAPEKPPMLSVEASPEQQAQPARCALATGSAMDMLRELLRADSNLLLWRSWPDQKEQLFYVWSTQCGEGLADRGEPTLEEAIAKFYRDHRHQLSSPNKPDEERPAGRNS